MSLVHDYLSRIADARRTGAATAERSLHSALHAALSAVGDGLSPKVRCIHEPANQGVGHPDFALFTAGQFSFADQPGGDLPATPERGVVEVKPPSVEIAHLAASAQVGEYWERYGLVLVTNLRSFMVLARDDSGRQVERERFDLASSEAAFWDLCAHPKRLPRDMEVRFHEFLTRALLHNATLTQPRDVAFFLASYAKDCLCRLDSTERLRAENPERRFDGLAMLRDSLEGALGVRFDTAKGMHFFHSTLVQTLFYGLFSAWVIWYRTPPDRERTRVFSAHGAAWNLRLPVLRALFEQAYRPSALDDLGVDKALDWAADVLRRVDGRAFFARFSEDRAVQYFYEPFLECFDPELRRQLGVWYTPPEVVEYMVARVDRALRDELGIPLGLADERVHVLDPCCGTGSFILAVLERIGRALAAQGDDALVGAAVKQAAMERVHGFEIMPAPFVVAHLQVGLMLAQRFGAPLDTAGSHSRNRDEWASIHLTNALTGHDPRYDREMPLPLPDLQHEVNTSNRLKREAPILVVIGNPPYNGFAGVEVSEEELALTTPYRRTRAVRAPEGQGLNDLYVRFWRMAERRVAEQTGCGVVCLITNYSWLDGLSYTGMRERFLDEFDAIWIDCLNGDKFKTGKKTPDGRPDPSIFSTPFNREGIQVGTAIGLMVRRGDPEPVLAEHENYILRDPSGILPTDRTMRRADVRFRHFWGADKRARLAALALDGAADEAEPHAAVAPDPTLGLPLVPTRANPAYATWPSLPELMPFHSPGVTTGRDQFLVDIDRDRLEARIRDYFDPEIDHVELGRLYPGIMTPRPRYAARDIRRRLLPRGPVWANIVRYAYRPFDIRWIYWEPEGKLVDEKRSQFFETLAEDNLWIAACQRNRKAADYAYSIGHLGASHIIERGANCFPLLSRRRQQLFDAQPDQPDLLNLSTSARRYLATICDDVIDGSALFHHALAILNTPEFLSQNADPLRQDWPRIPLPNSADLLLHSAALGRQVADLLDPDRPVAGVTAAPLRPLIQAVGLLQAVDLEGAQGRAAPDMRVTAGWGRAGKDGVCMPGRGMVRERPWSALEQAALALEARALGLTEDAALDLLGRTCVDVHLNATTCWTAVPSAVWRFTIGGYQVVKKWLSYRELALLGRPLTQDEAAHVRAVVRRLTALVLLAPTLDANYRACAGSAGR